jgi:hypothetical protein
MAPGSVLLAREEDRQLDHSDVLHFVVLSNSTPGNDDRFNDWYSQRHIVDVLKHVPGVRGVQRFALADDQRRSPPYAFRYLAIYEVEKQLAGEAFDTLRRLSGTEVMPVSDTFLPEHLALVFDAITPRLTPADVAGGPT